MGRHAQRRSRGKALPVLLLLTVGVATAVVAGWYLVGMAVAFGRLGADGHGNAWLFTGVAALGALACAVAVLALGVRCLRALGFLSDYRPRRAASRRTR